MVCIAGQRKCIPFTEMCPTMGEPFICVNGEWKSEQMCCLYGCDPLTGQCLSYIPPMPPTPTPPEPIPTPTPTAEIYKILIQTRADFLDFEIPYWIKNIIGKGLSAIGWTLLNIGMINGVIEAQIEKKGSPLAPVVVGIIIAALALIGVVVVSWTIIRVSDNKVEQGENIEQSVQAALGYCQAMGLDPDQCLALIEKIKELYEIEPAPNGFDWSDLMKNIPLIVGALLIITLVGAFKK